MLFRKLLTFVKRSSSARICLRKLTNDGKQVAASFPLRGIQKNTAPHKVVLYFFGSPMRNRTADSAVRGQRLNRLTMRPFFIVIEISLFMITYFFVFCKCLHARCGKILKFCLSGKDLNIFSKKTFTEILHILFFAIYLRRNHCSGGEYQKESGLFLSACRMREKFRPADTRAD